MLSVGEWRLVCPSTNILESESPFRAAAAGEPEILEPAFLALRELTEVLAT